MHISELNIYLSILFASCCASTINTVKKMECAQQTFAKTAIAVLYTWDFKTTKTYIRAVYLVCDTQ